MTFRKTAFLSLALFVVLGCMTISSVCKTVHQKYKVDPNEIKLIPADEARLYLAPFLSNAVNNKTHKGASLVLDETTMSCDGKSYPLTEWRLLEDAYVLTKDTGEIRVFIGTRDSVWLVGAVFGPTGKGLEMYLKASNSSEANKIVSALKSLGIKSFPAYDMNMKKKK